MASASASRPFPANQRGDSGIARLNMRRSKHDMPGIANIQRQLYVGRSRYAATADANRPACTTRLDQKVHDASDVAGVISTRSNVAGTSIETMPRQKKNCRTSSLPMEKGTNSATKIEDW